MLSNATNSKLILIGKVAATHGVRGQLRVVTYSGNIDSVRVKRSVIMKSLNGETEIAEIAASAVHGKKILITLQAYEDVNQVQHLVGREIYVEREQLPELDEGEYYWSDLIGLKVITTQGESLGEIYDIMATGSNDVYLVRGNEKEYLIPAIEDVVLNVNLEAGVMTVSPLEGLLEL